MDEKKLEYLESVYVPLTQEQAEYRMAAESTLTFQGWTYLRVVQLLAALRTERARVQELEGKLAAKEQEGHAE